MRLPKRPWTISLPTRTCWKLGKLKEVYSNLVYEDCWEEGDDIVYGNQLKELADHLIDNNLYEKHEITYFEEFENIGTPYSKYLLKKHWCNCGEQISISPEGVFYPCTRFQELSLQSDRKGRNIGNVDDGIDFDKLRPFRLLSIESCSSERCLSCDVATGCGLCSGLSYDCSEEETIFSRTEFICKMHKARVRARDYYFDRLKKVKNTEKNKIHFYTAQLTAPKNVLNVMLGSDSVNGCGYDQSAGKDGEPTRLDGKVLKECLALAKKEHYFVNLIYPESPLDEDYERMLAGIEAQRTRPYRGENRAYQLTDATVFVFRVGQEQAKNFSSVNVIVLAKEEDLPKMASYVEGLFKRGVLRVNLVLDFATINTDFNIAGYKEQLEKIADVIFGLQKSGKTHYLNVLSDIGNSEAMNNCNAGLNHVTLGFDGKLYLCPAAAYRGEPVETEAGTLKVVAKTTANLEIANSPLCKVCDAFHCRRCVLDNVTRTNEYRIPGEMQCILSHVEREVGRSLQDRMVKELNMSFANRVRELDYYDPFKKAKVW